MQSSVYNGTPVASPIPVHGKIYSIQPDLWQVGGFLVFSTT